MTGLVIQPRAQADIDEALGWYRQRDPRLVSRMLAELDIVFERICQNPSQFPVIGEPVQRALLRKFPYSVYFVLVGVRFTNQTLLGEMCIVHAEAVGSTCL